MDSYPRIRQRGPFYTTKFPIGYTFVNGLPNKWYQYEGPRYKSKEVCGDELHKGPPWRSGGPFFLKRIEMTQQFSESVNMIRRGYGYNGQFALNKSVSELDAWYSSMSETAENYGATGWDRFRPVRPLMDLGQTVGELRESKDLFKLAGAGQMAGLLARGFAEPLVKAIKGALWNLKIQAGLTLGWEFGWKPFLGDLYTLVHETEKLEKRIRQLRKTNGQWVRRRGTISSSVTMGSPTQQASLMLPAMISYFYPPGGATLATRQESNFDVIWFSATMKFWIPELAMPESDTSNYSSRLRRHMMGVSFTPSTAWELIPWSWLVDWFGNIGHVIANIVNNSYDQLVAKWAYVMRTRKRIITYDQTQPWLIGDGSGQPGPTSRCRTTLVGVCKERAVASPYGFGFDWPDFTDRQTAILTALGILRVIK